MLVATPAKLDLGRRSPSVKQSFTVDVVLLKYLQRENEDLKQELGLSISFADQRCLWSMEPGLSNNYCTNEAGRARRADQDHLDHQDAHNKEVE
jgi:hypothetical protein